MRRRSRTRRVLKWVGTVACVLISAMWVFSGWYHVVMGIGWDRRHHLSLVDGNVEWNRFRLADMRSGQAILAPRGVDFSVGRRSYFHLSFELPGVVGPTNILVWRAYLPLWFPFTLLFCATGLLWYLGRRRHLSGHCQKCGYDLTGNVSGRCPECGTAVGK